MTPSELRSVIDNLLDQLQVLDVALLRNTVVVDGKPGRRSRVGYRRADSGPLSVSKFGSIAEYRHALEQWAFSCVMLDGSVLQMSYEMEGNRLVGHRLAFLPCPAVLDPEFLRDEPILDVFTELVTEIDDVVLRSPLRFDYAPHQAGEDHPPSHLHFNHADCRCAVAAPLHPREFVRFVLRSCYPRIWATLGDLRAAPRTLLPRELSADAEGEFHLACRHT